MPGKDNDTYKYMYCIIRCPEARQFSNLGIGERGDIVHTVNYEDLAAVVSDSPDIEYDNSRRNMMAHTVVLEEVMREYALLPVRFGTLAPSEEAVRERILRRRYGEFLGLLGNMTGLVELGLKVFWYEDRIFQEIVAGNAAIRDLRDKLANRRPEESYYDRIRLGEMIEQDMWKKRDEDTEKILAQLSPLVSEYKANKVVSDRMVCNLAFLLAAERQPEFDALIHQLDEASNDRLIFKYVGPVPPYNFVNIVIHLNEEE